jgi:hypothetical protein
MHLSTSCRSTFPVSASLIKQYVTFIFDESLETILINFDVNGVENFLDIFSWREIRN